MLLSARPPLFSPVSGLTFSLGPVPGSLAWLSQSHGLAFPWSSYSAGSFSLGLELFLSSSLGMRG